MTASELVKKITFYLYIMRYTNIAHTFLNAGGIRVEQTIRNV